jgi:hypothetical protein
VPEKSTKINKSREKTNIKREKTRQANSPCPGGWGSWALKGRKSLASGSTDRTLHAVAASVVVFSHMIDAWLSTKR